MDSLVRLWREHESVIEEIIDAVSVRRGLARDQREDFASEVRVRCFDSEKSPLLRHEGRASWKTYLTVVITNLARDFANKEWGKWRPSVAAASFGEPGVRLEMLTHRDGIELTVAIRTVVDESNGGLTERHVYHIYARLPLRHRREIVGLEVLGDRASGDDATDAALWAHEREDEQRRAYAALEEALGQLHPVEAMMIRMRYLDGFTLARIGDQVGLPLQRVHERINKVLAQLQELLLARGVDGEELLR